MVPLRRSLYYNTLMSCITVVTLQVLCNNIIAVDAEVPPPIDRYDFTTCSNTSTVIPTIEMLCANPTNETTGIVSMVGIDRSLTGTLYSTGAYDFICDYSRGTTVISDYPARQYRMEGDDNLVAFQEHFTTVGSFSVALWIEPAYSFYNDRRPIITFGETQTYLDRYYECQGLDFRIVQVNEYLEITFTDSDGICQSAHITLAPLMPRELLHIVVTFTETQMHVYYNGLPLFPDMQLPKTLDIRNWKNANSSSLQLYSSYQDLAAFQGSLHQVDLYDVTLTPHDVATIFSRGAGYMDDLLSNSTDDDDALDGEENAQVFRLVAIEPAPVIIPQGSTSTDVPIVLLGHNSSLPYLQLAVQLVWVPSHGTLYTSSGTVIGINETFTFNGLDTGITVLYRLMESDPPYFNSPKFSAHGMDLQVSPESFIFRIVSFHPASTNIDMVSDPITVPVHVVHVNHGVPTLTAPRQATLYPNDLTQATVSNIQVTEHPLDYNIDRVRVDVWSEVGWIIVNPAYQHLAEINSCVHRFVWQCSGFLNGTELRRLTFLAVPDDISLIVQNIYFRSFYLDGKHPGEILIRIYDGVGGQCLSETEHIEYRSRFQNETTDGPIWYSTEDNECLQVNTTIVVPAWYYHSEEDTLAPTMAPTIYRTTASPTGYPTAAPSGNPTALPSGSAAGSPNASGSPSGEATRPPSRNATSPPDRNTTAPPSDIGTPVPTSRPLTTSAPTSRPRTTSAPTSRPRGVSTPIPKPRTSPVAAPPVGDGTKKPPPSHKNGGEGDGGLVILGFEWKEFVFGASCVMVTLIVACGWWRHFCCCCCKKLPCWATVVSPMENDDKNDSTIVASYPVAPVVSHGAVSSADIISTVDLEAPVDSNDQGHTSDGGNFAYGFDGSD